ncbi:amidohydrolase family protein [Candidatus Formimonas warabiya]|uniref:Uncharacterized protein n=1 Tax=Formimonas warabiya TaxID=1761012 RepID=A0A3G1KTQ3_FORW1|nr:amidohydrolase [Candidatus Formimonas warabiya]ATW25883.1 hypothetical protein DCMF_14875 [Candidatus Formimonas warabiya]
MNNSCKRQVDILIEHGLIVPVTGPDQIMGDGAVAIDGGKIIAVGPQEELGERYSGRKTIDARHKAVLPGLINAHCHFLQNFLKGAKDDLPLIKWIEEVSFPRIRLAVQDYLAHRPELQYYATLHGCIEALKCGITTAVNMEWATPLETIDVYEHTGIRGVHTLTFTDNDQWTPPEAILSDGEIFGLADRLIERCARSKDRRVAFCYGIACPNSCSPALISKVREEADKNKVLVHLHLAETNFEFQNISKKYHKTPTGYLHQLGILGPDVFVAHGIWLTDEDIQILKETGTSVVHNPECNMKIASGVAPIAKMARAGINISLGTDSCAVNDNTDLFETMRTTVLLQRVHQLDSACLSSYQALEMATLGGARAIGLGDKLGSLEPGKLADLILVDLTSINMRPVNNVINNLVYCANTNNVDTVIVDGKVVVEKQLLLNLDEEKAVSQAEKFAQRRFEAAGLKLPAYFTP